MRHVLVAVSCVMTIGAAACSAGGGHASTPTITPLVSANSTFLDVISRLGANTTLHQVELHHDTASSSSIGFPAEYRIEWWAQFGPDGVATNFDSNTTDSSTGKLIYFSRTVDGRTVQTTVDSGETRTLPDAPPPTADEMKQRLIHAVDQTVASLNAAGTLNVADVGGKQAYIVDSTWEGGILRSYVDAGEYRTLRTERIAVDTSGGRTIIESEDMPVIEVLLGAVSATP